MVSCDSVRRDGALAFIWVFDDVASRASHSEVMSFDQLAVTPAVVPHPPTSVVSRTVSPSGSHRPGARW